MPSIYSMPSKVRQGSGRCCDRAPGPVRWLLWPQVRQKGCGAVWGIRSIYDNYGKWATCVLMNKLLIRCMWVTPSSVSSQRKYLVHLNSDLRNESLEKPQLHFLLRVLLQDNLTYYLCVNNTFIVNPIVCLWGRLKGFTSWFRLAFYLGKRPRAYCTESKLPKGHLSLSSIFSVYLGKYVTMWNIV